MKRFADRRGHAALHLMLLVVAIAAGAMLPIPAVSAAGPCTGDGGPGGDWPSMNGNLLNQNNQHAEKRIDASNVADLEPAWITPATVDTGRSVPVIAGRCVYFTGATTSRARVTALDLRTGTVVWRSEEFPADQYEPFSLAVHRGRVHLHFDNKLKPRAAALDADTGRTLWRSDPVTFGHQAWILSSPTVFDARHNGRLRTLHLVFTTGPDWDAGARPGFAILDARTGKTLAQRTTIPRKDIADGYAGGGVWGTPAVDLRTLHAYVGTSNPYTKTREHDYDNAIIKIDVDPNRPTFGKIVDSYKGTPENLLGAPLYDQPACQALGQPNTIYLHFVGCFQMDIDFGNGPTLWRNRRGQLMLAQLQKDGTLHGVHADTMKPAWSVLLGTNPMLTLTGGNHGYAATDGERVYVQANPGVVHAVDADTGAVVWRNPVAAVIASQPVTVTNGVVYAVDWQGMTFWAWNAEDGSLLLQRNISQLAGRSCGGEKAGGVVIAHHDVVVHCQGVIVNFRVPGI